ncbi:P-loop NTPase fold protein [Bacillus pacificus]|uniref:P-loop NTPase fold protein n=1 Tax=Bacillus pacificus TaxID=2026187 RepID=UPI0011216C14|nr:P-loop NTPase fold protein [Bacillus pacificus]TNP01440.1 hypothetical protein FHY68_21940 [Bacillus pacificus]
MSEEIYYGESLKKWEEIKDELEKFQETELKETDARCKIIDPLLIDVFGWNEQCIIREEKIPAGFMDYHCQSEKNEFVLEAKSTKIDFKMVKNERYMLVESKRLAKTAEDLHSAIEQARNYGREKNSPFVIISNGLNIAIAQTYPARDGKYDTVLVSGIKGITQNFSILYQIISPYFNGNTAFIQLINSNELLRFKPQHRKTLLGELYDPMATTGGNELAKTLLPIVNRYFTDIADEKELLDGLYCDNANLDSYGHELKSFVKGRIPMLGLAVEQVAQVEVSDDKLGNFGQDMVMKMQDAHSNDGHVFVLFGNVGAGKTTFLSRFYHHILKGIHKKKLMWIPIDFQFFYGGEEDIEFYALEKIQEAIDHLEHDLNDFDVLKEIYEKEISRKVNGVWKPYTARPAELEIKISDYLEERVENPKEHIGKVIEYLKKKLSYEICIVFDNLDQQADVIQERVSLYALTKIDKWRTLIILSLRDETYWDLKKRPPLDAYARITSYQIVPPSVDDILMKRLQYVIDSIGEQRITFDAESNGNRMVFTMQYKDIFKVFVDTLKTEEAMELFRSLSSGNIRYALEIFRDLTTSRYSNLKNILEYNIGPAASYKPIPIDKLIKSIGLAQNAHYISKNSKIINMFQNNLRDGFYSHFVNFRAVYILKECSTKTYQIDTTPGFVPIEELNKLLGAYCNDEKALRSILVPLIERHLIETDIGARKIGDKDYYEKIKCVRITPSGYYYLNELTSLIQYLELVLFDTMIKNPVKFNEMRNNIFEMKDLKKRSNYSKVWELRFKNIEIFLDYLKQEEEEEIKMLRELGFSSFGKIMPEIIARYYKQKEAIEAKFVKVPSRKKVTR